MGNDQCCVANTDMKRELVDSMDRFQMTQQVKESLDRSEWEYYNIYFTIDNCVSLQRSGIVIFRRPIQNVQLLIQLTFQEFNIQLRNSQMHEQVYSNVERDIKNALELIFSNDSIRNFFMERIDDSQKDFSNAGNRKFVSQLYLSRKLDIDEQKYQSRQSYHLAMQTKSPKQQPNFSTAGNKSNGQSPSPDQKYVSPQKITPFIPEVNIDDEQIKSNILIPQSVLHNQPVSFQNESIMPSDLYHNRNIIEQLTGRQPANPSNSQRIANDLINPQNSSQSIIIKQNENISSSEINQAQNNLQNMEQRRSGRQQNNLINLKSTGTFPSAQNNIIVEIEPNQNNIDIKRSSRSQNSKRGVIQQSQQEMMIQNNNIDYVDDNNQRQNYDSQIENLFGTFNEKEAKQLSIQNQYIAQNQSNNITAGFNSQQPLSSNRMQLNQFLPQNQGQVDQALSFNMNNSSYNQFQTPQQIKMSSSIAQNNLILESNHLKHQDNTQNMLQENNYTIKNDVQAQSQQNIRMDRNRVQSSNSGINDFQSQEQAQKVKKTLQQDNESRNVRQENMMIQNEQRRNFPLIEIIKAERDSVNHYFDYNESEKHANPYEPDQVQGDYKTQFEYRQYQLQNSQLAANTSLSNQNISNNNSMFSPSKNQIQFQKHLDQQQQQHIIISPPPPNQQSFTRDPILIIDNQEQNPNRKNSQSDTLNKYFHLQNNHSFQEDKNRESERSQYFKRQKSPSPYNDYADNKIVTSSKVVYNQQVKIQ